jgi:hypothetical protein
MHVRRREGCGHCPPLVRGQWTNEVCLCSPGQDQPVPRQTRHRTSQSPIFLLQPFQPNALRSLHPAMERPPSIKTCAVSRRSGAPPRHLSRLVLADLQPDDTSTRSRRAFRVFHPSLILRFAGHSIPVGEPLSGGCSRVFRPASLLAKAERGPSRRTPTDTGNATKSRTALPASTTGSALRHALTAARSSSSQPALWLPCSCSGCES